MIGEQTFLHSSVDAHRGPPTLRQPATCLPRPTDRFVKAFFWLPVPSVIFIRICHKKLPSRLAQEGNTGFPQSLSPWKQIKPRPRNFCKRHLCSVTNESATRHRAVHFFGKNRQWLVWQRNAPALMEPIGGQMFQATAVSFAMESLPGTHRNSLNDRTNVG